jgi:putative transposase
MVARRFNAELLGLQIITRRVATPEKMANTYTCLHYHIVFSTKRRQRLISPDIENRLWTYVGGIIRENGMKPIQIGGVEDHIHVLLGAPATFAPSKIAQTLKGPSSLWLHKTFSGPRDVRLARRLRRFHGQ